MSLQGAYAAAIGDEAAGRISLERWAVYSHLKRTGYTVMRAPTWLDDNTEVSNGAGAGAGAGGGDARAATSSPVSTIPRQASAPATTVTTAHRQPASTPFSGFSGLVRKLVSFLLSATAAVKSSLPSSFSSLLYLLSGDAGRRRRRRQQRQLALGPLVTPGLHRSYCKFFAAFFFLCLFFYYYLFMENAIFFFSSFSSV